MIPVSGEAYKPETAARLRLAEYVLFFTATAGGTAYTAPMGNLSLLIVVAAVIGMIFYAFWDDFKKKKDQE
jgi:hypothetical protein